MVSEALLKVTTAKEDELYRKAFRKGLAAAAFICKPLQYPLAKHRRSRGRANIFENDSESFRRFR